jgi:hypothetical protein
LALKPTQVTIKELADFCLQHLVDYPEQLAEFMVQSGIGPADLRGLIGSEGFAHGLIDYVVSNEPLLVAVAAENQIKPESIVAAWAKLHHTEH